MSNDPATRLYIDAAERRRDEVFDELAPMLELGWWVDTGVIDIRGCDGDGFKMRVEWVWWEDLITVFSMWCVLPMCGTDDDDAIRRGEGLLITCTEKRIIFVQTEVK